MKKACMLGIVSLAAVQLTAEVIVTPADGKSAGTPKTRS